MVSKEQPTKVVREMITAYYVVFSVATMFVKIVGSLLWSFIVKFGLCQYFCSEWERVSKRILEIVN